MRHHTQMPGAYQVSRASICADQPATRQRGRPCPPAGGPHVTQSSLDMKPGIPTMRARRERMLSSRVMLLRYLANLSTGRLILWCYLIWYGVVLVRYFDPSARLWLTSLGLSGIIGFALYLSTTAGSNPVKLDFWTKFRLFLMPFCVSSFAALVKEKRFVLIFSPKPAEIMTAVGLCALLCAVVAVLKKRTVHRR